MYMLRQFRISAAIDTDGRLGVLDATAGRTCLIIQGLGVFDTGLFLVKVTTFCISSPAYWVQGFTVARPTLYSSK